MQLDNLRVKRRLACYKLFVLPLIHPGPLTVDSVVSYSSNQSTCEFKVSDNILEGGIKEHKEMQLSLILAPPLRTVFLFYVK